MYANAAYFVLMPELHRVSVYTTGKLPLLSRGGQLGTLRCQCLQTRAVKVVIHEHTYCLCPFGKGSGVAGQAEIEEPEFNIQAGGGTLERLTVVRFRVEDGCRDHRHGEGPNILRTRQIRKDENRQRKEPLIQGNRMLMY